LQPRRTGLTCTPYRNHGGNVVKKADRVGTVAHTAQNVIGRAGCGRAVWNRLCTMAHRRRPVFALSSTIEVCVRRL